MRTIPLLSFLVLFGCSGGGPATTQQQPQEEICPHAGPYVPQPGDTDGDGIPDDDEIVGYEIQVDRLGLGTEAGHLTVRTVTSDPFCPDTDEDGLDDFEEWVHRTDPRLRDTDGDTLTDSEEIRRWRTSPVSVDSDGDATGPDGLMAPNSALFDGNELKGHGTSPGLADTDGDGKTDFEEYDDPNRHPLLAEIPSARFEFAGEVDIRLRVTYEESLGEETEYGETFTTTDSTTSTTTTLDAAVAESEASTTILARAGGLFANFIPKGGGGSGGGQNQSQVTAVVATVAAVAVIAVGTALVYCATAGKRDADGPIHFRQDDPDKARGAGAEGAARANDKVSSFLCSPKTTDTRSTTLTEQSVLSAQETYSRYRRESRTRTETTASGSVKVGATVTNTGLTTVSLADLFVTMLHWQPSPDPGAELGAGGFRTLATLKPVIENVVLAPGETSPVIEMEADDVDPGIIKEFLARPGGIVYAPAGVSLQNVDGIDFKFLTEQTFARTATLTIDFGDDGRETYHIATNVDRTETGELAGLTLAKALAILDIPYETTAVEREIDGEQRLVEALTSVRGVDAKIVGETGDPQNGLPRDPLRVWFVLTSNEDQADPATDFQDMLLHHGDDVNLMFGEDRDGDGLLRREEAILGTDDTGDEDPDDPDDPDAPRSGFDTDGDTLSDFVEARVGWTISIRYQVTGEVSYQCFPNPRACDADGDTLDDRAERDKGTDPNNADTDDDGLTDDLDPAPLEAAIRLHVDVRATGVAPDGLSWGKAYASLQDALAEARRRNTNTIGGTTDPDFSDDISEIWVARGTYRPHESDRTVGFVLVDNVCIYGGFDGTELTRSQRLADPQVNGTVLSGDLLDNDTGSIDVDDPSRNDNSVHIVRAGSARARLDGFTMVGGNARGTSGGAVWTTSGHLTLANLHCIFNAATFDGAAAHDSDPQGSLAIETSSFVANQAKRNGGAVRIMNGGIRDSDFVENEGYFGGAVALLDGSAEITGCVFRTNMARPPFFTTGTDGDYGAGGAVYGDRGFRRLVLDRCTFEENRCGGFPLAAAGGRSAAVGGVIGLEARISGIPRLRDGVCVVRDCALVANQSWSRVDSQGKHFGDGAVVATRGGLSPNAGDPRLSLYMTNCTVAGNQSDDGSAMELAGINVIDISNSVFWGNTSNEAGLATELANIYLGLDKNAANRKAVYCCVEGLGFRPIPNVQLLTNIGLDPLFVDLGGRNARLQAGSPCIDAGTHVTGGQVATADTDRDGNPRVVDGNGDGRRVVDMGAFERP